MKKLMFLAACAASMVAVADVTSANIVGYNTVDLKPGYNMLSINFKDVTDPDGIEIDKVFPGGGKPSVLTPAAAAAQADSIMVYSNDGDGNGDYVTYFLYKSTKSSANDYWWVNSSGAKCGVKFKNGDSFWFYKRGSVTVNATVSGEVDLTPVRSVNLLPGYNMIGNFFPTGLILNDDIYTPTFWQNSGAKSAAAAAQADSIMVPANDGEGNVDYVTYFLYKSTKSSANDYKWVNSLGVPVTTTVTEPGQGVWYYHRNTGMTLPIHMPTTK